MANIGTRVADFIVQTVQQSKSKNEVGISLILVIVINSLLSLPFAVALGFSRGLTDVGAIAIVLGTGMSIVMLWKRIDIYKFHSHVGMIASVIMGLISILLFIVFIKKIIEREIFDIQDLGGLLGCGVFLLNASVYLAKKQ